MSSVSTRAPAYDAIVIGAGHNGLTAGGLLAKRGRRVLIVERCDVVGGLCVGDEFHPGYRSAGMLHDTSGLAPEVVESLQLERYGLVRGDAPAEIFVPQVYGPGLLLRHGAEEAQAEIAAHCERDAEAYGRYRAFLSRIGRFTRRVLRERPPDVSSDGLASLLPLASSGWALRRLGRVDMLELLRIGPMCVEDWLGEWFGGEVLKCALAFPAVAGSYAGPRSPGTNAGLIRHEALAGSGAVGGPSAVIDALESAGRAQGAEIRTGARVERIRVSGGVVAGVTLAGGETLDAPVVATSCDPKQTVLQLLQRGAACGKWMERLDAYRARGVTAKVDLALSGRLRFACREELDVEHARIVSTLDEMEQAFDAVKYGRSSERPILDVHVPTIAHRDWAPEGHSVASIVVRFAPYDLAGGWTDERREALGDAVVERMSEIVPGIRETIVARRVLTPVDIESRYGVTGGHVHHGEHGLDQLLVRPSPECARYATPIGGLYLCGSGSHPGGGLTCLPGALAADVMTA